MKICSGITALALIVILLAVSIFSTGCSCLRQACQPYGPRVTGDGSGGAIAVYEALESNNQHDFYVQKISPVGEALWGNNGVLIGSAYKECDSFHELYIMSDGSGGAFVIWGGYPSEPNWQTVPGQRQVKYLNHIARIDSDGNILWQREVGGVDQMISDGSGGVLIASEDSSEQKTLSVTRIDSDGNFPWGENGVSIVINDIYQSHSLGIAGDGAGGAIVIWEELQTEPGDEPHRPGTTNRIFARKIDAEGNLSWGQESILLYTSPEGTFAEELKVVNDGSGGAIAVWMQVPEGKVEDGSPKALLMDLFVQRVDASGNVLWHPNGLPLGISEAVEMAFPHSPVLVSDGSGGGIVIWEQFREGSIGVYAQKIGVDGSMEWQVGGLAITSSSPEYAVSGESGGVIITFEQEETETKEGGLYVQKINAYGETVWPSTGILVTGDETHDIAYDGQGGVIIAWGSGKTLFSSEKSYIQRVDADGKLLWGEKGIRLNP